MPTLLFEHVLQHGEKTVLQLRKELATFLQCELSLASASTVRHSKRDQQNSQRSAENTLRQQDPSHGVTEDSRKQEKFSSLTVGDHVLEPEKKAENGYEANTDATTKLVGAAHRKGRPVSPRQKAREEYRLSATKTMSDLLVGDEGGFIQASDRQDGSESENLHLCSIGRDSGQQLPPDTSFAHKGLPLGAEAERHEPLPGGDESSVLSSLLHPEPEKDPVERIGAGLKEQEKLQQKRKETVDKNVLAKFLASSPEVSRLLKSLFLLECLLPKSFTCVPERPLHTHTCSSICEDVMQQSRHSSLRNAPRWEYLGSPLCQPPGRQKKERGVFLQFLPKASVFSRLLKDVGNALLAQQQLDEARFTYTASLRVAPLCAADEQNFRSLQHDADHSTAQPVISSIARVPRSSYKKTGMTATSDEYLQQVAVLLSNRSAVRLKQQAPVAALRDATAALQADPTYSKAWYRRSSALLLLADLFHAECYKQRCTGRPSVGMLQCQNHAPAATVEGAPYSVPCVFSSNASGAVDRAGTVAADTQSAVSTVYDKEDSAHERAADADACCSTIERLLREEAAYSLARSVSKQQEDSVASVRSSVAHSLNSSVGASSAVAASPCRPFGSLPAAESTSCTLGGSSSSSCPVSPSVPSSSLAPSSRWDAPPAWDGAGAVFRLGVCACEAAREERSQHKVAGAHEKREEAQFKAAKDADVHASAGESTAATKNPMEDECFSTKEAAVSNSAADPRPLSEGYVKTRLPRELANKKDDAPQQRVSADHARESLGARALEGEGPKGNTKGSEAAPAARHRFNDEKTRLLSTYSAGVSKAFRETGRMTHVTEETGCTVAADYSKAHQAIRGSDTEESKAPEEQEAERVPGTGKTGGCDTPVQPPATMRAAYAESGTPEEYAAKHHVNLLESFAVYIHPDIETHKGGPLGTSVHWRAKCASRERRREATAPRLQAEAKHHDARLVLEEFPAAAYCTPTQNSVGQAALPMVEGKTHFLKHWKKYLQEQYVAEARAVCAGCFRPVGACHQGLEGSEWVRVLYRQCRIADPVGASQNRKGGCSTAAGESEKDITVNFSKNKSAGSKRITEFQTAGVAGAQFQMEWRCRHMLRQVLSSVELVVPCSTCNAALFCCLPCRDASHHVAICRRKIGIRGQLCTKQRVPWLLYACEQNFMPNRGDTSLRECVSQPASAIGASQRVIDAAVPAEAQVLVQSEACTNYQQGSTCVQNEATDDSAAREGVTEGKMLSVTSTLKAAWGLLTATSALGSLVAAAFRAEERRDGSASSMAVPTSTPAVSATCGATLRQAAEKTSFEIKRAEYLTACTQLRVTISRSIQHQAANAWTARATVRGDEAASTVGRQSLCKDGASAACENVCPRDLCSRSGLERKEGGKFTSGHKCACQNESSCRTNGRDASSFLYANSDICGWPLKWCELPVAYTAGGALDDGTRHLARQIFPFFVYGASRAAGRYIIADHPVTRLTSHLPADIDKLCDFLVNAVWLAGEYCCQIAPPASCVDQVLWNDSELPPNCAGAGTQKCFPPSVPCPGGTSLVSGPHGVAGMCEVRPADCYTWGATGDFSCSVAESAGKENEVHFTSSLHKVELEDERYWAWLRSPKVLEAALTAYGVACANSFAVTLQQDEAGGWTVGRALYLFASQFNHSCSPNTIAVFDADVPPLLAAAAIESCTHRGRSPGRVRDGQQLSKQYFKGQHSAHEGVAGGLRSGCVLKLRYYGSWGGGPQDPAAPGQRGKGGTWRSASTARFASEELTISYVAVAGGKRGTWWTERQRYLREEALFECRCAVCRAWATFLATSRKPGPRGLPPLFPLLPDHLQCFPCRQCYTHKSERREHNTTLQRRSDTMQRRLCPEEELNRADVLQPVVTLLCTGSRSRQDFLGSAIDFEDALTDRLIRSQHPPVEQYGLEDVVALRGGALLLKSICDALVPACRTKGFCESNEGVGSPCGSSRTSIQHRVTCMASLGALGHSLVPVDGTSDRVQVDFHGNSRRNSHENSHKIVQTTGTQPSGLAICNAPVRILDNVRTVKKPSSRAVSGSGICGFDSTASGSPRSKTSLECKKMVERPGGLELRTSTSTQHQHSLASAKPSISGSSDGAADRNRTTSPIRVAASEKFWVCLHCKSADSACDSYDSLSTGSQMENLRRSIEASLRMCNKVKDPLKRGEQLLHSDEAQQAQLCDFLFDVARTTGQLSHEVCTVLDMWAMWATECAALASGAENELFSEWSRVTASGPEAGRSEPRCNAVAEMGCKVAKIQRQNRSRAFRLLLGATWVHSMRFPHGWLQPELCAELYKCAVLAGNAGCTLEGRLLANAAKVSGTAAYGPRHPVVLKVEELLVSFRPQPPD